jgi:hypothetical protein
MADRTQQIEAIEEEIRTTPHHKGTEHHIGRLRARLARLKDEELESSTRKGGGGGGGYAVKKQGDATIVLVGPPSAGKSTLINKLTNAESKVAPYAFTTVTVVPGMMVYQNAYIQILDIPGLIEGAMEGKGEGKRVLSVARGADLLVIMTDTERADLLSTMEKELHGAGIRINQKRPEVLVDKKPGGGVILHTNIRQDLDKETIKEIAQEFGIKNGDITLKETVTIDSLIDVFSSSRVYIPAIFVVNKVDLHDISHVSGEGEVMPISAQEGIGLENFKERVWKALGLARVYLVGPDEKPNYENPIIMRKGQTLKEVAEKIGPDFASDKKLAKIWGEGAQFPGQEVSLTTKVLEGMQVRF